MQIPLYLRCSCVAEPSIAQSSIERDAVTDVQTTMCRGMGGDVSAIICTGLLAGLK